MIRLFSILALIFFFSCNQGQKHTAVAVRHVDYDTLPNGQQLIDNNDSSMHFYYREVVGSDTLKGGYILCYGLENDTLYLYLRNRDSLTLLNTESTLTSAWSVGTLEQDFDSFFITRLDNGNGSPFSYQLFDKKTGSNVLGDEVRAEGYSFLKDTLFMLYDNSWVKLIDHNRIERKEADSVMLYSAVTKRREKFSLPPKLFDDYYTITLENLTRKSLVIKCEQIMSDNKPKLLTFKR